MERTRNANGQFNPTHNGCYENGKRTRLYRVWCAMKERCSNPHNKRYNIYGGRGISVCEEWKDYSVFRAWMLANGYKPGRSIDRIDSDGNYCPENCRLVDTATQNRNYSRNHLLTYNGRTQCVQDWAAETGLLPSTILFRLRTGKSIEEALEVIDLRSIRFKK